MNTYPWIKRLAVASVFSIAIASAQAAGDSNPLADNVRAANDRFQDVSVAVAEGYAPLPCVSGVNGGAMGIHYVNSDYLKDDVLDIARPEAVMYEPMADGKLALVAVEYATFKGPASLEGHLFHFNGAPIGMVSTLSTSCTCGPGSRIRPAPSRT